MPVAIAKTADLGIASPQQIYTVPVNNSFTGNVRMLNRNVFSAKVRIAICKTDTPTLDEYIEYDATIPPNEVLENTAIIMAPGERLYVYSDTAGVSVRAHGIEESL